LKRFRIYDIVIIAVMAALGVAIKPVVVPIVHAISMPLMIPGGSLAGGLYMMWLVLAFAITGRFGAGTLTGLVQAIMVILVGIPGSHGVVSLFSYVAPGLALDLAMFLILRTAGRPYDRLASFIAGIVTNVTGTLIVNSIFMKLPPVFLALSIVAAALSGGLGGLIAWELYRVAKRYRLVRM
jgi:hypothetical protein